MTNKLLALGGAALALLVLSAVGPADARGRHGAHSFRGPVHRSGPSAFVGSHRHRHHHHRRLFIGAPLAFGYYYGDDCYWLRRRALYTGSRYWWNRYYACIYRY